jgi:hypothetical protein
MLRREGFYTVDGEEKLKIDRLLGPQRAVVVERSDALGHRHKVRRAFLGHPFDEGDDRLFRCGVVPGRQGISSKGYVGMDNSSEQNINEIIVS